MKVLILNTDYPDFLDYLYGKHPGLDRERYSRQLQVRDESLFGVASFYARHLRELGHEATVIHANNGPMQAAWAREHGKSPVESGAIRKNALHLIQKIRGRIAGTVVNKIRRIYSPLLYRLEKRNSGLYSILATQIDFYKPDLVLNLSMDGLSSRFFQEARAQIRLLVGQHAAPIPAGENYTCYDLVLSSLPNQVEFFRDSGLKSRLFRLAFEPSVLEQLSFEGKGEYVSFVGSLSSHHGDRIQLLEKIGKHMKLKIWTGAKTTKRSSTLAPLIQGEAWGREMFQVLARSRMVLNHHIGISGRYANNMRLYEATGVGTLLVTDWKENLGSMFETGKEVVAYRSPRECIELMAYYFEHPAEAEAIAKAGQRRTLREHTYRERMEEMIAIFYEEIL
ncbi:MAG: glycosyltransferase [Deltaproteobacteria bacterium]|nr:glycosyltransferase [Deltaproteobacteria bacterium]